MFGVILCKTNFYGNTYSATNFCRIRIGLSALRSNFKRKKYNLIFDDICPAYGTDHDTVMHYLFNCITYNALRETMLHTLRNNFPEHCELLLTIDENQKHKLLHIFETGLN